MTYLALTLACGERWSIGISNTLANIGGPQGAITWSRHDHSADHRVSGARDLPPADTVHGLTLNTYPCAELAVGSGVALKELTARLGQSGRD